MKMNKKIIYYKIKNTYNIHIKSVGLFLPGCLPLFGECVCVFSVYATATRHTASLSISNSNNSETKARARAKARVKAKGFLMQLIVYNSHQSHSCVGQFVETDRRLRAKYPMVWLKWCANHTMWFASPLSTDLRNKHKSKYTPVDWSLKWFT